jgi:hypothetical protein
MGSGNFGTSQTQSGKLALSWDDPLATGVTLDDDTVIFTVSFEVVGGADNVSPLVLMDSIANREVAVNFASATFLAQDGLVSVGGTVSPQLGNPLCANNAFCLSLATVSGKRYILEFADRLPAINWTALPAVTGDGTVMILTDPAATVAQRFYRVRIE